MKRIFWTLLAIGTTALVTACNKGGSGGGGEVAPACTLNAYGQCVNADGQVLSITNPNLSLSYFADNWSNQRSVTITDQMAFREFLRTSMGVCDRMQYTGGTANCNTWISGGLDIILMVPNNNPGAVNVTIRAWPQINSFGYSSYQSPGVAGTIGAFFGIPAQVTAGGYFNPMSLSGWSSNPVNASAGFELRTYGPLYSVGNRSLIQVRVDQGKLGDNSFSFKIGYPSCVRDSAHTCNNPVATWFAQGTFSRCQTANCSTGLW